MGGRHHRDLWPRPALPDLLVCAHTQTTAHQRMSSDNEEVQVDVRVRSQCTEERLSNFTSALHQYQYWKSPLVWGTNSPGLLLQWAPLNRITVKGIFWLMEYNLQVQNHLYIICTIVKELLKGIPLKGIFWI